MKDTGPTLLPIHEDDAVIVLAKPAGMPSANAPRGVPSAFSLVRSSRPRDAFLGVVSRLDAPVSGVIVFAKSPAAAASLAAQFRERAVHKEYLAVVEGRFPAPLGQWVDWHDLVERHPEDESPRAEPSAPRAAHVRARVTRRLGEVSLVELVPSTGRRHQLRQQLSRRGCPIVGDRRYGARLPFPAGIALHAHRLALRHPTSDAECRFETPVPLAWRLRFPGLSSHVGGKLRRPGRPGSGDVRKS
ncbi:MAG: RNA pseudouridine synthase [Planctomycetia bacterium]|nr:RNA pseudouridine synthase [Planctomycetia bacterium]